MPHFDTALRPYTGKRIEEIESADILIGIPCYNNESTIEHVIQMVSHGIATYYKDKRSVIFIADGGSTDDTRDVAKEFQIKPWQEKIVSIYRGPGGKGSALRSVFEAAGRLHVSVCAVVDSDLRSITSDWVKYLLDPVLEHEYQFVSPVYMRHKYDGTITNNIVYSLTRALYGKRIRQPIGGDFAFSRQVAKFYAEQEVWETDVARFGIDIWMSTSAITNNFRICQSNLGVKIHDVKDPSQHLGPMFRQVLWTLFSLMETYEKHWRDVEGSSPLETFGMEGFIEPEPVKVNLDALIENFKLGFSHFGVLWKDIFSKDCYNDMKKCVDKSGTDFLCPMETWVRILYELAATFHAWPKNRYKLVELVAPLYYGRVASFVNQSRDMSSKEAEELVEEQAESFEQHKGYLVEMWDQKKAQAEASSLS
ncbi:MAG TPA: glycosyltransferase [Deltaproteobacteria bacterium]|nr:glycosyltransferase [Deltaproteobacteria bacterium]HPJ92773.1 glycosyltransferase [Deltaproteobacteria bacterium]HPR50768.1 glycosyltransferase [Deltaproteobacteria bacterium]